MNDALFMRRFERFTNILCDFESFRHCDWATPDALCQRFTFDKFEDEVTQAVCFLQIVDGGDIGVIE